MNADADCNVSLMSCDIGESLSPLDGGGAADSMGVDNKIDAGKRRASSARDVGDMAMTAADDVDGVIGPWACCGCGCSCCSGRGCCGCDCGCGCDCVGGNASDSDRDVSSDDVSDVVS